MEEQHFSLSEVAIGLRVSERTVRRWIKSGKLRASKPGRDYRIPESAVKALIEEGDVSPKVRAPSPEPSLFNGLEGGRREADITTRIDDLDEVAVGWLGEFFYGAKMRRVCIERLEDGSAELRGYRA